MIYLQAYDDMLQLEIQLLKRILKISNHIISYTKKHATPIFKYKKLEIRFFSLSCNVYENILCHLHV